MVPLRREQREEHYRSGFGRWLVGTVLQGAEYYDEPLRSRYEITFTLWRWGFGVGQRATKEHIQSDLRPRSNEAQRQKNKPECKRYFVTAPNYACFRGERRRPHWNHNRHTIANASHTIFRDILEWPWNRSVKMIGTSAI